MVMLFPLVCTGSLWPTPAGGVMTVRAREGIVTTLPLVHMGGQKSRRRAKRREGDRPPRPAAQTPEATRVDPPDVAAARADSAPTPLAVPPTPASPIDYDPALAEQDRALQAAFVRDDFADTLPTLEDFSRRDAGKSRRAARRAKAAQVASPPTAPLREPPLASPGSSAADDTVPRRPSASPKTGAERTFELLSFDTIDERPAAEESYDLLDKILGKGVANKADAFYLPYLQTGHVFMLLVLLLACSVTYPGFPLTQVPADYRELLQQGLAVTFVVNTGCAWYSRGVAAKKRESVWFWMVKCFLLGGLALGELVNAVPDPAKAAPTRR